MDGKLAGPSGWKGQILLSDRKHNWWCLSQMLMPMLFNVLSYNLDNEMKCTLRKLYFPVGCGAFFRIECGILII